MTLYLLKFNNYYNRIIKKYDTIEEYEEFILEGFENVNFNPNNNISTSQIINYNKSTIPDYVIICDELNKIISRWFIIDSRRTRAFQFEIDLYRDVISDWMEDVLDAPMFIEKALCNIDDSAIFNNENMSYNQIKTSEWILKDTSNCPWIVGYVTKDFTGGKISIPANTLMGVTELSSLDQYTYYKYNIDNPLFIDASIDERLFRINFYSSGLDNKSYIYSFNSETKAATKPNIDVTPYSISTRDFFSRENTLQIGHQLRVAVDQNAEFSMKNTVRILNPIRDATDWAAYSTSQADWGERYSSMSESTLFSEDGKVIKVGDIYYQISVNQGNRKSIKATIPKNNGLGLKFNQMVAGAPDVLTTGQKSPLYEMEISGSPYYFSFVEITPNGYEVDLSSPTTRSHLTDSPYDMFAIPCGELKIGTFNTIPEVAYRIAQEIERQTDNKTLLDLQLLPYAPFPDNQFTQSIWFYQPSEMKITNLRMEDWNLIVKTGDNLSAAGSVFWINGSSKFTKYINHKIEVSSNNIEFKIQNECDKYRLCSPNWNGSFEFSATKNNGVTQFRCDLAFKPINPYIRIAPVFGGLYGPISSDARGLICGGDFSFSRTQNEWIEYLRQNQNYQRIFDRQIENIEVNNSMQRISEQVNVATGTLSGAVTGGMGGAMMGGGYGAAAGAIVGGGSSLAGGIADVMLNEQLRTEALDYTKDQFGYQLGNIKALPTSIIKVDILTPNSKIYPVLEYYTCTGIEKEALRSKIRFNGMTVMRIGNINQFRRDEISYIKGKLIRLEAENDNFNIVNTISYELNKGVFI